MENRRKPAPPAATLDINCDCKEAMSSATSARGRCGTRPGNPVHNPQAEAARAN
jgi:hypothetical protein